MFDDPARCMFQNMVQFNGFHGCPYCLTPGETVKTSERGHTHAYPFNKNEPHGHHEIRTQESMVEHGTIAEKSKQDGKAVNKYGVKGLSWFHFLPKFDIVRGVAVDYMHCMMLGIVKMLLSLWFDKSYKSEHFNISDKINIVNERLMKIKPPNFIGRLPRPLTDLSHYKAAEYKTFMLYYSLPCLWGILPNDIFGHYLLLVQLAYTLLSNRITPEQLEQCNMMALQFCINLSAFYGPRYMTSNVHLLLHITDKVRDLGPLWANSCFYFEDYNGQLRSLFHGTQNIDSQIGFAVCVHQNLNKLSACLIYGTTEYDLYHQLTSKNMPKLKEMIESDIYVLGSYNSGNLSDKEKHAIFLVQNNRIKVSVFKRVIVRGQVIHSRNYKSVIKRNSCVVKYGAKFGYVQNFVRVIEECFGGCVDFEKCPCRTPKYYALINKLIMLDTIFPVDQVSGASASHLVPVSDPSDVVEAVLVCDIDRLCVFVRISENLNFVSCLPNVIEKE